VQGPFPDWNSNPSTAKKKKKNIGKIASLCEKQSLA
jgi:hypothetical protein